jgi:sugar lactone lactonase YvrE
MKASRLRLEALSFLTVLLLQVCTADAAPPAQGSADRSAMPPHCKVDTTPDTFSFVSRTKVAANTLIESEAVTISGINVPARLSIAGGEYSIDGRAYRKSPGAVRNGERVRIRIRASRESWGVASATLTIGGVSGTFTVKTASPFRSVSTLAAADPWAMDGLSVGPDGNIYVSGGQRVLRMTPDGEVSVFATGLGSGNDSGFDSRGNLYVADYRSSAVHKITPEGVMTTFASALDGPAGLWVDRDDNVLVTLYGANFSGTGATVLSIAPDGTISTYASGGPLMDVVGIVGDERGQIYASNYSSGVIFNITGGNVSLLAGTGVGSNQLCYSRGGIYVPSPVDDQIRRVDLDGAVDHFAGTTVRQTIDGPIDDAGFLRPSACDFAEHGRVMYVLDWESGLIRKIDYGRP